MPWTKPDPEWVPEEYPKALNKDEAGRAVPVVYPAGHEKQGHPVVFANKDEESAYRNIGKKPAAVAKGKKRDDGDGD